MKSNRRSNNRRGQKSADESLRRAVHDRLLRIGFSKNGNGYLVPGEVTKETVRCLHRLSRKEQLQSFRRLINERGKELIEHFANGTDVEPTHIDPELVPVYAHTNDADLFRMATLLWSVPVSQGFGRRLRFLVRDRQNGKLIGVFGLTDPVFNLAARDAWIGWSVEDRRARLVQVMDAYVVGAVPPYAQLIGGKLVAALMTSANVMRAYENKYRGTESVISRKIKPSKLVLLTTTSALGRSSIYIKALRRYSVNAVSFVSADGGDNRLTFNPSVIELVRVVDSRGNECALDAVPNTAAFSELEQRIQVGSPHVLQPLQRLCADLAVDLWDLSYLLRAAGTPGKSTGAVRCYRDIVEWSVLYDLVTNPAMQWGSDTILVRDGLLRTKSFTRSVFPKIDGKIREAIGRHKGQNVRLSLVGVAKQSAVLGTLALALELEAVFDKDYPCYVRVPTEIEEECYNYDRTWLDTYETSEPDDEGRRLYQSFGNLFLVKFGDRKLDPVWPVDIAEWQVQEADRILGQLTVDAQYGFPIPDYPMCIQRAHDYAKITGLEVEVLQDLLIEAMEVGLTPDQTERLLRLKHLGRSLAALRYKEA